MRPLPAVPMVTNRPGGTPTLASSSHLANTADVLVILEDFLISAEPYIVEQLAEYSLFRIEDPYPWVSWIVDLLGEHAALLRALIPTEQARPAPLPIGEPR